MGGSSASYWLDRANNSLLSSLNRIGGLVSGQKAVLMLITCYTSRTIKHEVKRTRPSVMNVALKRLCERMGLLPSFKGLLLEVEFWLPK